MSVQWKTLSIGEPDTFNVHAQEQYSWSDVRVESGGYYVFTVPDGQEWIDKNIKCGPDGWRTEDLPWYKEKAFEYFEARR